MTDILIRDVPEDVAVMREFFEHGMGGAAFRDDRPLEMAARFLGMVRTAPGWMLVRVRRWIDARARAEAGMPLSRLVVDGLRGRLRIDGLTLTSHHFMSPDELRTPVGQDRLAACVFRLPYKGEMVPMCQMNADGVREKFYAGIIDGTAGGEPDSERRLLPVVH